MSEPVPVRVRDCVCPGSPHPEGDNVYLSPTMTLDAGLHAEQQYVAAMTAARTDPANAEVYEAQLERDWFVTFVRYGVTGWDFQNDEGQPLPLDVEAILNDYAVARPVGVQAAALYAEVVLAPFRQASPKPSPRGRTARTTSRRKTRTKQPSA